MNEPVTVGIITHNEENKIAACIESLRFLKQHNPMEVVLVDNASTDETVALAEVYLKRLDVHFTIIRREKNHMAQARNDILKNAKTKWVYMIDADCQMDENTWPLLIKNWIHSPEIAARGGSQQFREDFEIMILLNRMRENFLGHFGSAQMKGGNSQVELTDHISTTHVLYDREILLRIGGFNKLLSKAAEDLELSLRLKKCGYELQFIPESFVWHDQASTWKEWAQKAFRNGMWQTRLIPYNIDILKTRRPWPGILAPIIIWFPYIWVPFFIWYLFFIIYHCFTQPIDMEMRKKLILLFYMTHILYGVGEVVGVVMAGYDFIFST